MIVGKCACLRKERLWKTSRESSIVDGLDIHVIIDLQIKFTIDQLFGSGRQDKFSHSTDERSQMILYYMINDE